MSNYLKVSYDENAKPYTSYPKQLANYLFKSFNMQENQSMLEIGCGRGEMLQNFKELGLDVKGIDLSPEAPDYQKDIEIKVCNVENEKLPYEDNIFDIIYSKSVLEHLLYPENYMKEAFRVLKQGGIVITLTPDWESTFKIFYDDPTHKTPFTTVSLTNILKMNNFNDIVVYKFRQLPLLWKYPMLNIFSDIVAPFVPVRTKNKFLRWSCELMLVSCAKK